MPRNPSRKGRLEALCRADRERDSGPSAADLAAVDAAASAFLGIDPIQRKAKPKRPALRVFVRRVVKLTVPPLKCCLARHAVAMAIERGLAAHAPRPDSTGWADQIGLDESEE